MHRQQTGNQGEYQPQMQGRDRDRFGVPTTAHDTQWRPVLVRGGLCVCRRKDGRGVQRGAGSTLGEPAFCAWVVVSQVETGLPQNCRVRR